MTPGAARFSGFLAANPSKGSALSTPHRWRGAAPAQSKATGGFSQAVSNATSGLSASRTTNIGVGFGTLSVGKTASGSNTYGVSGNLGFVSVGPSVEMSKTGFEKACVAVGSGASAAFGASGSGSLCIDKSGNVSLGSSICGTGGAAGTLGGTKVGVDYSVCVDAEARLSR
jgi:hypothetical protein